MSQQPYRGRSRRRERGQSLIEVAVGMTFMLIVALGFLRAVNLIIDQEAVDQAARVAANAGAVQARLDQACAAAISYGQARLQEAGLLKGSVIRIATTPQPNTYQRGGRITVSVSARIPGFFGGTTVYSAKPASELIQPGRGRFPVRQRGSACITTA
jgi:Flp pilus assembly protein TadG